VTIPWKALAAVLVIAMVIIVFYGVLQAKADCRRTMIGAATRFLNNRLKAIGLPGFPLQLPAMGRITIAARPRTKGHRLLKAV